MATRVVVVGGINMDLVVSTTALPAPGETVIGGEFRRFGGGKGANQAVAAARLGAEVALIGSVGADEYGEARLNDLRAEGIDVSHVRRLEEPTGVALITVDRQGENTIVVASGANAGLGPTDVQAAHAAIRRADIVVLQLEVSMAANARGAQLAREAGVTVILSPSPVAPMPARMLEAVSYLVANEGELVALTEGSSDPSRLLAAGVGAVVVTRGERGARLFSGGGSRQVAAFRVASVDSTAAGDAFLGALAATLSERGVDGALRAASAAGALATTRNGALPSLPTLREVDALLATAESGA